MIHAINGWSYSLGLVILALFSICYRQIQIINEMFPALSQEKDNFDGYMTSSVEEIIKSIDIPLPQRLEYYKFFREEIEREDGITNQRTAWFVTFQGFLISSVAVLMVYGWSSPDAVYVLRKSMLIATGIVGFVISLISYQGIMASRHSIRQADFAWKLRNRCWNLFPRLVPQPTGQGSAFAKGTEFVERVPLFFAFMWVGFISLNLMITYLFEVENCLGSAEVIKCILTRRFEGMSSCSG